MFKSNELKVNEARIAGWDVNTVDDSALTFMYNDRLQVVMVAHTTPVITPTATVQSTPEATPTATAQSTPEATPTATVQSTPTVTVQSTPEATPTATVQSTPEATPTATALNTLICLPHSCSLNVIDGKYTIDSNGYIEKYGLNNGTYVINVPETHPIAILNADLTYSGTKVINKNLTVAQNPGDSLTEDFYYGTITLNVNNDFGLASLFCYYHGYMGGENMLQYSSACPISSLDNMETENTKQL